MEGAGNAAEKNCCGGVDRIRSIKGSKIQNLPSLKNYAVLQGHLERLLNSISWNAYS